MFNKNNVAFVLVFMCVMLLTTSDAARRKGGCNLYEGNWVVDESYPLFDTLKCPFVRKEFDCLKYGRPDRGYLKYRWQPNGCNLPRFDGREFLMRLRGKSVMFIGDSVSDNHWQSLLCLLHEAVGGSDFTTSAATSNVSTVTFKEYNVSISMFLSHYLVDIFTTEEGRVLNLDSIRDGDTWKEADVLIFNTWLWWYRRGPKQPWDLIEVDGKRVKDMDRMEAFRRGLLTWSKWVNANIDPSKTKVFFQGISPSHYNGSEFGSPGATNCSRETTPLSGSTYPGGVPLALKVLKQVLRKKNRTSAVHLLDVTTLSQLRRDGHPSKYNGFRGMDCTHWCISGVPDTWNNLLYAQLMLQ